MANFCTNCGKPTHPGAAYCTVCGQKLPTFAQVTEDIAPVEESIPAVAKTAEREEISPAVEEAPATEEAPASEETLAAEEAPASEEAAAPTDPIAQEAGEEKVADPIPVPPMAPRAEENSRFPDNPYEDEPALAALSAHCVPAIDHTVSTGMYFLLMFLFALPVAGWIVAIVLACGGSKNPNIRHYAAAFLLWMLLGIIVSVVIAVFFVMISDNLLQHFGISEFEDLFDLIFD